MEQERKSSSPRVLSIQSHVVSGYVGNKAAVFPMQVLGLDVDILNTVQFSNHTGYPSWKGSAINGEEMWKLIEGMNENHLLNQTHLLTGYLGNETILRTVEKIVHTLRSRNDKDTEDPSSLVYLCDPVLGDNGKLYIPESLIQLYKEKIMPLADIITPNQFELELLSGTKIATRKDVSDALDIVQTLGIKIVILTSISFADDKKNLTLVCSDAKRMRFEISFPYLEGYFTGTGDCFAALILAWYQKYPNDLEIVCERALATLQAMLRKTKESGQWELKVIQCKSEIENPEIVYRAQPFQINL